MQNFKHPHLGNLIKQKLNENERSVAWLARKVGLYHRCSLPRILEKISLDSYLLCRISIELNENLLDILSQEVQKELCCKNATKQSNITT